MNKQHELVMLIKNTRNLLKISMMYDKDNWRRHHELSQLILVLKDELLSIVVPEAA